MKVQIGKAIVETSQVRMIGPDSERPPLHRIRREVLWIDGTITLIEGTWAEVPVGAFLGWAPDNTHDR